MDEVDVQPRAFDDGLPMLAWCHIPAGEVIIGPHRFTVPQFRISQYPVTNAQFSVFAHALDGYTSPRWWQFAAEAAHWHQKHPQPLDPRYHGDVYPRANVCWYEAVAFCRWLSHHSGLHITLPTEAQRQRAAQGDDHRLYPWGAELDPSRCNIHESQIRQPTPVNRYSCGVSPYGVWDMLGNVWEWCSSWRADLSQVNGAGEAGWVVRGGSFVSSRQRVDSTCYFLLKPVYRYITIGFRLACAL